MSAPFMQIPAFAGDAWWLRPEHIVDGVGPGFFADVLNRRSVIGAAAVPLASVLTVTAASGKTYIDGGGVLRTAAANEARIDCSSGVAELLLEGAATNLVLNSATLSTQSVTVSATAYTLSFTGTGTVTLSGASTAGPLVGTGAANRVSLTFTPSAGTLTLTVSGSVTQAQLETGSIATSYIPTTASAVTRATDLCQLTAAAASVIQATSAAVAWRGVIPVAQAGQQIIGLGDGLNLIRATNTPNTRLAIFNATSGLALEVGTDVIPGALGICAGWGASGTRFAANGVAASAVQTNSWPTTIYLGPSTGLGTGQVFRIRQLVGWTMTDRPSAEAVTAQARLAA